MTDSLLHEAKKAYSVKEITRLIKNVLETKFSSVWIEGEISNFKKTSAGHAYFTLKDESAQISAVMFRFSASKYLDNSIANGIKIRVFGNISVYEKSGNYQIICSRLEKIGLGDLQIRFLKLKEKLYQMGWFDSSRKKQIPLIPKRIAILTSKTGAAVRDMLNIIFSRWPNMNVLVFPVKVQGNGAKEEIASAIRIINDQKLASVMIVGRGGGSIEDLWAFNEFIVAEAIYHSEIPVISAVGHEIDFTISDFVADVRAETPSAAATLVVPVKAGLVDHLDHMKNKLETMMKNRVHSLNETLNGYKNHYCFQEPINLIRKYSQRIDDLESNLSKSFSSSLSFRKEKCKKLSALLKSLSPYNILKRGYSITQNKKTGQTLKSIQNINLKDELIIILPDGKIESVVHALKK